MRSDWSLFFAPKLMSKPRRKPVAFEVVVDLGAMLIGEVGYGLDFDDDLLKTEEVRLIGFP